MYTFIVNPHARSGMGQKVWDELEALLKQKKVSYEVHFTKYQKHATALVAELTADGEAHTLIALGGDGTVNEVVNGISDFSKIRFGYIPIGSGNDFARGMKLPSDPDTALSYLLKKSRTKAINIGELSYKGKKRRFAVSTGFGFDADICHESAVSRLKFVLNKLKLGKLTYVCIALHRLLLAKPCTVKLTVNQHQKLRFEKTFFVAIMNSPYEGGGVKFCPKAKNDDDKLDILVASNVSKLKVLCLLPLALFGLHTGFQGVTLLRCEQIEIESEKALPVHTDGEPIFLQNHIKARCLKSKLRVMIP
ncbi:MAG: diacylglycerol kinase family protein [Faecalimonas sp.]|nr:diacylglycerol kinase family protein [Faecalimonas sp.]